MMMAYAELHMPSLLTSIVFLFSINYHNDDDTRLMKIWSHDTNSEGRGVEIEWRVNCSPLVTDQMESSLALFCDFADMAPKYGDFGESPWTGMSLRNRRVQKRWPISQLCIIFC